MSAVNRHGLVKGSGGTLGVEATAGEDFPMLARDTPPLPPGRPFADDLDRCDRLMGARPRSLGSKEPSLPAKRRFAGNIGVVPPDPALPIPPRSFVGPRVGYGARLAPLTFTIRGGEYAAKADLVQRSTMDAVFGAVEAAFAVRRIELMSPRRDHAVRQPRFAACLLAIEFTDWSLPRIGLALGGRDHSTIINGIRRARWFQENDPVFATALGRARASLRAQLRPSERGPRS